MRMRLLAPAAALAALGAHGAAAQQQAEQPAEDAVARGEYLVTIGACNDCHTPWTMGSQGPEPDMSRRLSGHPEDFAVEAPAALEEPWVVAFTGTNTAFSGPWGVSFASNLTADPETGYAALVDEEQFIEALRTGRHQGQGRPILPPMPWPMIGQMTDDDLRAVFAYLQQVEPIRNQVPDPVPPAQQ
jgi:mono/diheme cytochrome c family protein